MSAAEKPKLQTVRPLSLRHTAGAVARNYSDKGAIVITYGKGIVRIGSENLTPLELREFYVPQSAILIFPQIKSNLT